MEYWATVLDIIEAGLANDQEKVRGYAELLLTKLDRESRAAKHLRDILEDKPKGAIIHLSKEQP